MNTKIVTLGLLLMLVIPVIFFINPSTEHHIVSTSATVFGTGPKDENHSTSITVDQKDLQLDQEVVQFKIIFYKDDRINVSCFLKIQQSGIDLEPQACLLILTNGTETLFRKTNVSLLLNIPSAILFDTTIFGHRIAFGGRVFYKLLNLTRFRVGAAMGQYNDVHVQKGDVWYLTMAEANRKPGGILTITVRSLSSSPSIELVQIDRHSNIGFYSALDNDFEGRYMGFKLPILPFGFSVANNLHKEVVTSRGSVIYFCSVGHAKGRMKVEAPNNKTYLNLNNKLALFTYCGNLKGTWNFYTSGVGFPWKHNVMLFYADVDPHLQLRNR
jgi:hypothetical protein